MRARSTQLDQAPVSIEVKADFALRRRAMAEKEGFRAFSKIGGASFMFHAGQACIEYCLRISQCRWLVMYIVDECRSGYSSLVKTR